MNELNWAGNVQYRAQQVHRPTSVEQVRDIVRAASSVHVLGTRHSFNHIADADELISLGGLDADVVIDAEMNTVEVGAATTYGALAPVLLAAGRALANLASLPHISVGGAIATGTHGSGDRLGNLATAVCGLEIMRADGEMVHLQRGDPDFDGAVVGLGALGVVLRVRLTTEPAVQWAQRVSLDLPWHAVDDDLGRVTGAGDSVSMFTTWGDRVDQVWVKRRVGDATMPAVDVFGAVPATDQMHPIRGASAEHCTEQLGVPGPWADRLPHFRLGFTPSSGDEIQSELHLPRAAALDAFRVLRSMAADMAPHLLVSEIRTVAADTLWMSSQFGRDTVAVHFTWRPHAAEVQALVGRLEAALAPFEPRPHWGKVFTMDAATLSSRFERHGDFVDLVGRFDPRGTFSTPWLRRHVLGGS